MNSKAELTIAYSNFWKGMDMTDSDFELLLSNDYQCRIVDPNDNPDVLIYSCEGSYNHLRANPKIKIFYTGENMYPDFNQCDYAISFHYLDLFDRHLRLPNYCLYPEFKALREGRHFCDIDKPEEREFCSIVVSKTHYSAPMRAQLFDALSQYKALASGGRWNNNVGGPVKDKAEFISNYKFNLAIENSSLPGYVTEKILQAFYSRTVPIYWGDPLVAKDFNPASFINVNDYRSIDEAVDYIRHVDQDRELYMSYLNANPLLNNPFVDYEHLLHSFLVNAVSKGKRTENHGWIMEYNKWQSLLLDIRHYLSLAKKLLRR